MAYVEKTAKVNFIKIYLVAKFFNLPREFSSLRELLFEDERVSQFTATTRMPATPVGSAADPHRPH